MGLSFPDGQSRSSIRANGSQYRYPWLPTFTFSFYRPVQLLAVRLLEGHVEPMRPLRDLDVQPALRHLAVGVWFEDYRNAFSNEGGVHIIYGSRRGLRAKDNQFWHQDSPGTKDRTGISDQFGQTLAAADFDGDGFDDLAVGAPSTDLRPGVHQNQGAVHVFRGSRRGLTARGDRYLTQDSPGVKGRSEKQDHFGASLSGADFDGDGYADLVVGIPWEDLRSKNDGAVYVIQGSKRGLTRARDRLWSSSGSDLPRRERRGARFGWSLSSERPASGTPRTASPRI